jgi:transmembrane sensor
MNEGRRSRDDGLAAEAAAGWFARLQGEAASGEDWLAFERWLSASPANARAYERLERLWVELDRAPIARELGHPPRRSRHAARRPGRRAWIGVGAALAAGLAVAAVGVTFWPTVGDATQGYRTAPGQTRTLTLADGTRIRLNAASQITVSLSHDARRVTMADAEAVFDVAHDARRPFLITVGDRQVRVVGTEFNLRHRADLLDLTVRRGTVEVRPADELEAQPTRVSVGQELTHVTGQAGSILKVADPDQAFAWTNGQLIYRDQPISDVAADLTRRFGKPVRVADARTAALRFSGVLVTDSEPAVLRRLEAYAPVRVERTSDAIILHHR